MPTYIVKGKFRDGKPYAGERVGANADEVTAGLRKEGVTIASIAEKRKGGPKATGPLVVVDSGGRTVGRFLSVQPSNDLFQFSTVMALITVNNGAYAVPFTLGRKYDALPAVGKIPQLQCTIDYRASDQDCEIQTEPHLTPFPFQSHNGDSGAS